MNYKKMYVSELRQIAEEKGIRNISSMKKNELALLLENIDKMTALREKEEMPEADSKEKSETKSDVKSDVKSDLELDFQNEAKEVKKAGKRVSKTKSAEPKKSDNEKSDNDKPLSKEKLSKEKLSKEKLSKQNLENKAIENVKEERKPKRSKNSKSSDVDKKNADDNLKQSYDNVSGDSSNNSDKKINENINNSRTENSGDSKVEIKFTIVDDEKKSSDNSESKADIKNETQIEKKNIAKPQTAAVSMEQVADGEYYDGSIDSGDSNGEVKPVQNEIAEGILEVMSDGFGFIRSDNYMPGERDIYVSPSQIRKFRLRTGDIVKGPIRRKSNPNEKFSALLFIDSVNGYSPSDIIKRKKFEDMTPIFPDERIHLDYTGAPLALRIVDLVSPIGKGQRGMIVSPPKAGKTTLLKQIAKRISTANPEMNVLVLLIDERPEEVTDIKESIEADNAEVIYSTFDELPEHHKRVSEMVIERAKRLVESGQDVVILVDSITRLARAYNLTVAPSGRTLSGGLDPAALHMPKKFFGAARNMREGGSLTILATALIDTGSRMDDVVFEEFKGTGNMELVLDRNLQEKRVFPAIDISKSGTRKDDLLLTVDERDILDIIHRRFHSLKAEEVTEELLKLFAQTKNNEQFVAVAKKLFQKR